MSVVRGGDQASRRDARHRLAFVDIAEPGFDPAPLGVDLPALNRELHARLPDGRMLTGLDSIRPPRR